MTMEGDWDRAWVIAKYMVRRWQAARALTLNKVGGYMVAKLKKGMRDQNPGGKEYTPNHPFTIERKKSSKALINHGDLLGSITYQMSSQGDEVFVGVLRQKKARTPGGQMYLANLAEIHEEGRMIQITPKMRGWLRHNGLIVSPRTKYIVIPARPTFGPVFEAEREKVLQLIQKTIAKELGF